MSNTQIQKCIRDVLGIDDEEKSDWNQSHMRKLLSATSTLYNASLNKVMLKQGEETARCHLCAYIAAERLAEKHVKDLQYYMDRIPLEPKKIRNLLELFRQQIFQSSPVKNFSWTPSPKKRRSPVKDGGRFTAKDPNELRKQLFGTPTKLPPDVGTPRSAIEVTASKSSPSPSRARRKLAFEEDTVDDQFESPTKKRRTAPPSSSLINDPRTQVGDDEALDLSSNQPKGKKAREARRQESPSKKSTGTRTQSRTDNCLLRKKHSKVASAEVIDLCNQFEIPKDVAYSILDHYVAYASFLVCPWQLLCGLVLNATLVVFTERRRKDPRVDHLIFEKMAGLMKTSRIEDIIETLALVKELLEGEKWFRDLQVKHNYYDGACYEEAISAKLGSMLQPNNILVSDEQLANWRRKVEQELSLRDLE
ncbi:hypothetical protein HG536_0D03110 [Torulaspora globosa]|uniref:ORC6 first cyclin-like domain-containing protein n=1 Tax=Torulaspora globosa TaxID=48254 RepID=A0A7G3ZH03_9SACH|nr:uncharacterized protein HG536_0D03110 [Torulaspora globosa]QLL32789.1 hypothetical protein HG536_0D03110 [Torulaspora globosa]